MWTIQKINALSNRKTSFTNNKPRKKWFQLFLAHHPEISVRAPETLTHSRAKVSEAGLRMFKELDDYFCKGNLKEILKDPPKIYSCDEAAFLLCPKTGKDTRRWFQEDAKMFLKLCKAQTKNHLLY